MATRVTDLAKFVTLLHRLADGYMKPEDVYRTVLELQRFEEQVQAVQEALWNTFLTAE